MEVNWANFGSGGVKIFPVNWTDYAPSTMADGSFVGRRNWIIKLPEDWGNGQIQALAEHFPSNDKYVGHPSAGALSILIVWADKDELAQALHEVHGAVYVEMDADLESLQESVSDLETGLRSHAIPWGLDRIDSEAELDGQYIPGSPVGGKGVHVYVMDSGIKTTHGQFGGRAVPTIEVQASRVKVCQITDSKCANDKMGHGTHAASVIGGTTLGVAQGAWMHAVKITNEFGHGKLSSFLMALDWILANAEKPAVIHASFNISLRSHDTRILVDSVNKAYQQNVPVVIGAGNDNADACEMSPAYVPSAITVGASTVDDLRANFSNWGHCLDIFAPGKDIRAAHVFSDTSYALVSGTSVAAAHVAGALAVVFGLYPNVTVRNITELLLNYAFIDAISDAHEQQFSGSQHLSTTSRHLLSMSFETGLLPVVIGASDPLEPGESPKYRKKCVKVPKRTKCAVNAGDYGQRLGWDHFKDAFKITVDGEDLCAERYDNIEDDFLPHAKFSAPGFDEGGWSIDLVAVCQSEQVSAVPSDTWVFEDLGGSESMCAGANPRDRKSINYLLYEEIFDKSECERLCKVQHGCKGYSFLPGHDCEVWLKDIKSFVKYPNQYASDDISATCTRVVGRGQAGEGLLHLASHPSKCLSVAQAEGRRTLFVDQCKYGKSEGMQNFTWSGVGKFIERSEKTSCLTASDKQVLLEPCSNSQRQVLAFQGTGTIRIAGNNASYTNLCIAADEREARLEECDATSPSQQFLHTSALWTPVLPFS